MGLDLYIEARICEQKTGQFISFDLDLNGYEEYTDDEDKGFFEICYWCGWDFCDIRDKIIEINNQHTVNNYTNADFTMPVPQSALRDIYGFLIKRSCLADNEYLEILPGIAEWHRRMVYEKTNLINATKLHDLLWVLNSIQYDNCIFPDLYKEHIPDKTNQILIEKNPQAYKWEFRIFNSY